MRVAYVCADPGVPVFGAKGASLHVQGILRALAARGAFVELIARRTGGPMPDELRAHVRHHDLGSLPKGDPAARERAAQAGNPELEDLLRALGPLDLVYERYSLWSWAGMAFARERGIPGVLEVNAPLIEEQAAHRVLVDRPGAEAAARRTFATATACIAVSEPVNDHVRALGGRPEQIHTIGNGVDPARFPKVARPRRGSPFTVGFVGTLKPWHGLDTLGEAFARLHDRHPDCRLLVVGDGPQAPALRTALAARGRGPAATFTGALAASEVPAAYACMDVATAPYPALEPFYFSPLKVVEAMAAGLPVVASRVGALPELVVDGVTGRLTAPGDAGALAEALAELRADPSGAAALGAVGRRAALAAHTWSAVLDRVLKVAGLGSPAGAGVAA